MKKRLAWLLSWRGAIERGPFLALVVVLVILEINVDRLTLALLAAEGDQEWLIYWRPALSFRPLSQADPARVLLSGLVSLPFVWIGVMACVKRLRSASLPVAMAVLYFVPLLNLVFFATLAAVPRHGGRVGAEPSVRRRGLLARWIPDSDLGSATAAILITLPPTVLFTWFGANVLGTYGWGLFLGVPFALGLAASLIHGVHRPRSFAACAGVAMLSIALVAGVLFGLAIEGAICIAMAAPIGIVMALLGALVGWSVRSGVGSTSERTLASIAVVMPLVVGWERLTPAEPTVFAVRTAVVVEAPPERVWQELIAFSELPPPEQWVFRTGIAYPIRAEIDGHGVGAVRRCVFSTGAFVEPIEVWDEPRLLRFSVAAQPPVMRELVLIPGAQPPHVHDYLVSQAGQFLLEPLAGGRTRLEGTTWYTHRLWPERYWKPWSDSILHLIHRRVLDHVAALAEGRT